MILKYDGDMLDFPDFLAEAIRAENVELVKLMAQKIEKHEFTAKLFLKLAEQSGNEEILEYLNSLIKNPEDLDSDSDNSFDRDELWETLDQSLEKSEELESSSE